MKKHNSYSIKLLLSVFLFFTLATSFVLTSCSDSSEGESASPTEEVPTPFLAEETSEESATESPQASAGEETIPELTAVSEDDTAVPEPEGLTAVINSGDFAGEGKPFTFDATQSQENGHSITAYEWNMGDGTILFGIAVEHAYSDLGIYTVSMTITDENGATDTATKTVEIIELSSGPPVAVLEGPDKVAVGAEVEFSAAGSQPGGDIIVAFQWDSGDGDEEGPAPQDTWTTIYEEPGVYYPEVTVFDANGLASSAVLEVSVEYSLSGTSWSMDEPIRGTEVTLVFGETTHSGSSGCNDYSGSFSTTDWDENTANISIIITNSTNKSCSQEIMHQERGYHSFLQNASRVSISENKMTLESSSGSITFSRLVSQ